MCERASSLASIPCIRKAVSGFSRLGEERNDATITIFSLPAFMKGVRHKCKYNVGANIESASRLKVVVHW